MPDRDTVSGSSGGRINRVGFALVAIVLGSLVPVGVSAFVASRDSLPASCHAGSPTSVTTPGVILFSDRSALSLVEGDPGRPRKLLDYGPGSAGSAAVRSPGPTAGAPASPPSATPSATPSGSPSPSPTGSSAPSDPQFVAAAISTDHKVAAYLVTDPPGAPGVVSLRLIDLTQPPPYTPTEAWNGPKVVAGGRGEVRFLPNSTILFLVPQRFDSPEKSTRLVGVVQYGAAPKVSQLSPEEQFTASLHATWPETKDYQLPDDRPQLQDRVLGPNNRVAGRVDRHFRSPVTDRTVHQIATGRLGQPGNAVVCAVIDDLTTAAFSPDGRTLVVSDGANSHLLDAGGGHSTVFLLRGRVLDWRT